MIMGWVSGVQAHKTPYPASETEHGVLVHEGGESMSHRTQNVIACLALLAVLIINTALGR